MAITRWQTCRACTASLRISILWARRGLIIGFDSLHRLTQIMYTMLRRWTIAQWRNLWTKSSIAAPCSRRCNSESSDTNKELRLGRLVWAAIGNMAINILTMPPCPFGIKRRDRWVMKISPSSWGLRTNSISFRRLPMWKRLATWMMFRGNRIWFDELDRKLIFSIRLAASV